MSFIRFHDKDKYMWKEIDAERLFGTKKEMTRFCEGYGVEIGITYSPVMDRLRIWMQLKGHNFARFYETNASQYELYVQKTSADAVRKAVLSSLLDSFGISHEY